MTIGTTDNLMDYSSGTKLCKYQWDRIHNPINVVLETDDEEEAVLSSNTYVLQKLIEIKNSCLNNNDISYIGSTYSKIAEAIKIGGVNYSKIVFYKKANTTITISPCQWNDYEELNLWTNKTEYGFNYENDLIIKVGTKKERDDLKDYLYSKKTNIQQKSDANGMIFNYQKDSSRGSFFTNLNKNKFCSDLQNIINNPDVVDQRCTPTCGAQAIAHAFATKDPVGYTTVAIELFEKGKTKWNNISLNVQEELKSSTVPCSTSKNGPMSIVDFVVLTTLTDNQNMFLDYTHPNSGSEGFMWPASIVYYMENLVGMTQMLDVDGKVVSDEGIFLNKMASFLEHDKNLSYAQNIFTNGGITIIFNDWDYLESRINGVYSGALHYITFDGNYQPVKFQFDTWHRGGKYLIPWSNQANLDKDRIENGIFSYYHFK